MSYDEIDTETISTDAGAYVVKFINDECHEKPYNEGLGFAFFGKNHNVNDVSDGEHAPEVLSILEANVHGWNNDGTADYKHSSAGIARYLRLKYGLQGIREVSADYQASAPDSDRSNVFGMAWIDDDADGWADPEKSTAGMIAAYRAWAEGDVFGYVVTGPDGNEIHSCWGFYGFDSEKTYALEMARDEIDYDVSQRLEKSNLVGAGFVGLI